MVFWKHSKRDSGRNRGREVKSYKYRKMDTDGEAATEIGVCVSFENIGTKEVALESSEFQTGLTKGAGRNEQGKKKIS